MTRDKGYDKIKESAIARNREMSRSGRDIGDIPPVVNSQRKGESYRSFRLFCEYYFPLKFYLDWSADHLRVIDMIERSVIDGGLFAVAMPRGQGKTTLVERAVIWAVLTGRHSFVFLIGNSEDHARDMLLENIKTELSTNTLLLEDFPESVYPIHQLEGEARRCSGQLHHSRRTLIKWAADSITMPDIPGSRSAGAVIRVAGLTGNIRGALHSKPDGTSIRPSLVLLDDPQTDQSARSPAQCAQREAILSGAILNLAGPGRKIAGIMPCTVIRAGDLSDNMLNRELHPEWQGDRTKLVYRFPTNEKLWDEYAQRRADELRDGGDGRKATAFYKKHRRAMDKGAEVAWEGRYNTDEISAIQNAMNLLYRDRHAFFAEYQNDPLPPDDANPDAISAGDVAERCNGIGRGVVPHSATTLVGFMDVQEKLLWWVVAAFDGDMNGAIVDYGAFPDQRRRYFTLADATKTLRQKYKGAGVEGAIQSGMIELGEQLIGREWKSENGGIVKLNRLLIDSGNWAQLVYAAVRKLGAVAMASKGVGIKAGSRPMTSYKRKPGERHGLNWYIPNVTKTRESRHVLYDTNYWKTHVHTRFATTPGDPGAMTLFGNRPSDHAMIADHIAESETSTRTEGHGRVVYEFKIKPNKPDNHDFDCVVGCCVAASIEGCAIPGTGKSKSPERMRPALKVTF